MDEYLRSLVGAGTNDVLAAFLGSVCGAFGLTKPTARLIFSTIIVGTIVGTYFGPSIPPMIGLKPAGWITLVIGSIGTFVLTTAGNWMKRKFFEGGPK